MQKSFWQQALVLSLAWACMGCGGKPAPADTGAREIVQNYFEALIQRDWNRAHDVLDPESQARYPRVRFVELARKYAALGFEPTSVKIRSCEEQGNQAIARVFLIGKAAAKERRYRDAVTLRRTENGWRVVLPASRAP